MADTLTPEQKFYKRITTVKLTDRPIFKGSVQMLKGFGYDLSTLVGKSKEKEGIRLYSEKGELLKGLQGELKNLSLLENMTWNNLSNSDKEVILKLVKDIQELSGVNIGADHIQDNTKEVLSKCIEVLDKVGEQAKSLSEMKSFSHDNLKGLLSQMDGGDIDYYHKQGEGILVPSKDDLDIVTALKMTGIDLEFNGTKWELKSASVEKGNVSFVPTKDGKPLQVFGNENIQFLLEQYLNVPQDQRTQTVVPNKLLQVYVNEYERQMMEGKDPSSLEGGLVKQDVARQRKIFSMDSNEFQITKLLDRDTIMRNAQKMAMVSSFEEIVKTAKDTSEISDSIETTIESMSTDPAYRDIIKGLNKLVPMLEGMGDKFEDATEFEGGYNVDFVAQYDRQIEYLEKTGAPAEHTDALKKAKAEFEATVAVQQTYWQTKLVELANGNNGNIFSAGLAGAINESMGFAVMQKDGGDFVMANGETVQKFLEDRNLSTSLYQQLRERAQNKGGNTAAQETKEPESGRTITETVMQKERQNSQDNAGVVKYPDISGALSSKDEYNDAIIGYANLSYYRHLWKTALAVRFQKWQDKNPGKGISDLIEYLKENPDEELINMGVLDLDVLEEAYYYEHQDEKCGEDVTNRMNARINAFNKHILITDIILSRLTDAEKLNYHNLDPDEQQRIINREYKHACDYYDELKENPNKYNEMLKTAKKRHEAGLVGSTINTLSKDRKDCSKVVQDTVDSYLNACAKEQQKNNADLAKNGEPIVGGEENTAENEEGNKKPNETTYGKMFPSGPNVNKFLKKMKPYHAKEITKYFIEPLLEAIDGIIINMDQYNEKINATKYEPMGVTNNQNKQMTPEQQKEFEEKMQQHEQETVLVMQRHFEASAFVPAAIMFQDIESRASGKSHYESADKLQKLFSLLSKSDELGDNKQFGVVDPETKTDVRDALRALTLRVCSGDFKNTWTTEIGVKGPVGTLKDVSGSQAMKDEVKAILTKYQVPEDLQRDINAAFELVTTDLIATALEPVIEISNDQQKATISPKPIDGILKAKDDNERISVVRDNFDIHKHEQTVLDLDGLVSTIYRTHDGSTIDKKSVDISFVQDKIKTEFGQVGNTAEMKKMMGDAIKEIREKAGLPPLPNAAAEQAEAEEPEMCE